MFKQSLLRSTLLLAGGIVLTVVVLIASEAGNIRLRQGYTQVIQSQQVQGQITSLLGELVNAEAGQRGFLLTGKESYLQPYYQAVPRINALMSALRNRYADDPEALKLFTEASTAVNRKLTEMDLTLIYGKRDVEVALDLVRTDFGKQTMDNARRGLEALLQREAALVPQSLEYADRDLALSRYGIGLLTAINIVLLIVVGLQHSRRMAVSEAARSELEEESARLDNMVRSRTRQLSALASHLQRVTEDEKTRLARELHDEMGANLTAIGMYLSTVGEQLKETHPEQAAVLGFARKTLIETVQLKRRIVEDLRPSLLDNLGLAAALQSYCEDYARATRLDCEALIDPAADSAGPMQAIALFRIAQESLNNIAKYAQARHVVVHLAREGEGLALEVSDDGVGIPPDAMRRSKSHGLLGMRERALLLNGTLKVERGVNGVGTCVQAWVPLESTGAEPAGAASVAVPAPAALPALMRAPRPSADGHTRS